MRKYLLLLPVLLLTVQCLFGQTRKPRLQRHTFVVSLIPGFGTFGWLPGSYESNFAFNIFGGYSYANRGLEISLISAANVAETRGIQIAGVGNVTGLNYDLSPFPGDEEEYANMHGIQLAGVVNYVRDYVYGIQLSTAHNRGGGLIGFQGAIFNKVKGFGTGGQLGVYNWVEGTFQGAQVGALVNETNGRLIGLQLAPVNIVGKIEGKNTNPEGDYTGVQLGLFNLSGHMHGFQIGLVNIGKKMRGTQIGLINISTEGGVPVNKRNGTMIGLINIGEFHSVGFNTGELFLFNVYAETGTMKNGQVKPEGTNRYFTSSLEYSFSPIRGSDYQRMYGVGLHKYYYNRNFTPGMMEKHFYRGSMGIRYLQLEDAEFSGDNFHVFLGGGAGYRIINKWSLYLMVQAYLNYAWAGIDSDTQPLATFDLGNGIMWPGWRVGVAIH